MSEPKRPPTPEGPPLFGHGIAFSRDPFGAMQEWAEKGEVVHLKFPTGSQYMVTEPELIKQVLVEQQDAFTIGARQRETFKGIEDNAVTASTGDRWRSLRKELHPAFTWDGIQAYGNRMAKRTAEHVERWKSGDQFDLLLEMRLLTVRILGDTLLGIDMEGNEDVALEAADALVAWADFRRFGHLLPDWVPTPTQRRFDRAVSDLDDYVDDVLKTHSREGLDVCAVLLSAYERGNLSWREVRDNTVGLMLAGHDSTAVTLTYVWYELSRHPEVLDSLRDEITTKVGDQLPTVDDFNALTRLQNVIRETLRLYPPTWTVSREATEATTLGAYSIPAGTQLVMPQWVLHRDDRFWDAPETFDPSRWEHDMARPEYAYFPFSGGPRHCVGMRFARLELALALATMINRVDLNVSTIDTLTFIPSLSLRPETDIEVSAQPRRR